MAWMLSDIKAAFERGEAMNATHMIVVCDTYDWQDYPVYVMHGEDPREVAARFDGKNMQKIMECYRLSLGWQSQMKERRAFHWESE